VGGTIGEHPSSSPSGAPAPGCTCRGHLPGLAPCDPVDSSGDVADSGADAMVFPSRGRYGGDNHTRGGVGSVGTEKAIGEVDGTQTDGGDLLPGHGYSLTTFRVVSCVHPTHKATPGSEMRACLGRNVYVLWSSSRLGVSSTVDAFRAAGPSCIGLERGAGALRFASEEEAAAAGVPHTNRLLFLRGNVRGFFSGPKYQADVQLLLEAPSPGICMSWVTGGRSLLTPWEALVGAGLNGWNDATCVHELLLSVLPPLPQAADNQLGILSRLLGRRGRRFVLNAQHWLAPPSSVGLAGLSAMYKTVDAVDQVSCFPVVGPALRLGLLVVQVGALAVLADDQDAQRKGKVSRCEGIAFDLLCRIFAQLREDPTEFGAACVEQLCALMAQVESVLEEVEATFFMSPVKAAVAGAAIPAWEQRLKDIYEKQITSSVHGAIGRAVDRVENGVDGLMVQVSALGQKLGVSPLVDPDLSVYKVGWRPPVLDGGHVAGVDKPNRVEHAIVSILKRYAHGGDDEAPRVSICAIGGSGKSSACAEVATCQSVRTLFPRGTIWVRLTDASTTETVTTAVTALVCHMCGEATARRVLLLTERDEFIALAAAEVQASSVTDASKWLVAIDDVRDDQAAMLKQLLLVMPRSTPVLFTTRSEMVAASVMGAVGLTIKSWPKEDARVLLARAVGKRPTKCERPFSEQEEAAWVQRVLDLTQCHVLSVSIVAALVSARCGMWRPVVAALECQWTDFACRCPLTEPNPWHSVRATLDTSRALLPDDDCRGAFAALGILPANERIGLHVLERVWRQQLGVAGGTARGSSSSRPQTRGFPDQAVHPGVYWLVDALVRAGLLHQEIADGDLVGVVVHPVICRYAQCMLGKDHVVAHQRLVDQYSSSCPPDGPDSHGWLGYHFWATADDGYWYNNVARHAAAADDVLALASLMTYEWCLARARAGSPAGHQGDVGLVLASLHAFIGDTGHAVHDSRVLLGAAHWGLAMAFLFRMGYATAANEEAAIILLKRGLDEVSRAAAPLLWAEMQNDLGTVYSYRDNGDKAANFQKAVGCLYRALEVRTREAVPFSWAETQHCLGMAYADRQGGDKTANMAEAMVYLQRALDVRTREMAALQWAETTYRMGTTYAERVDVDKVASVEEAVACYRRALEVWTPETAPLQWAGAQHSMGTAYAARVFGDKAANMEEALACFHRALQVRTQEVTPLAWATTQNSMGAAYTERVNGDKAANMEQAEACYCCVLDVWTQEAMPKAWVSMQLKLADLYEQQMGSGKEASQASKEMVACYLRVLEVWTRETSPHDWAGMQERMGLAYSQMVDGGKAKSMEEALACYRRALEVWKRETEPHAWAHLQVYMGAAYAQRVDGDKAANLDEAVSCYQRVLEVWTRESAPRAWAQMHDRIGRLYLERVDGDKTANMEEALARYQRVLEVWTREASPRNWVLTQLNLAYAHKRRMKDDGVPDIEEALACIRRALEVLTPEMEPLLWASAQHRMGLAYADRVDGDRTANLNEAVAWYRRALEVRTREAAPQWWASTTWRMLEALQGAKHWAEALEAARALQVFGREWERWDEIEADLVNRVVQLVREVEQPPVTSAHNQPLPGIDDGASAV